jgi:hypothetical protein
MDALLIMKVRVTNANAVVMSAMKQPQNINCADFCVESFMSRIDL